MSNRLLEAALYYADFGYKVFPCAPGTKKPLTEHGFLDATCNAEQVEAWWQQHPQANIGIATAGLLVIDVDGADNCWLDDQPDKLLELTVGPMSITPRGGSHRIFRQPAKKSWRCSEGKLAQKVDVRADGGYIIAPPSVLTGDRLYRWVPEMALDRSLAQLAEPPAWLTERLDDLATGAKGSPSVATSPIMGNEIPTGQRNSTLARLAGSMRRVGMSQAEILAAIVQANQDRCRPPLPAEEVEKIATSVSRYAPDEVSVAVIEDHYSQLFEPEAEEGPDDPGPFPEKLLQKLPEIVKQALGHYRENAVEAQPVLFLGSLIAATGTVLGHKVRDASGLRTNIYTLGITISGGGKEATREVIRRIFCHAGIDAMCGPEDFASDAGLIAAVQTQNPILFQLDEFGRLMHCVNQGSAGSPHLYNIASVLLKMYGKANSVFRSKAYADPKRNKQIAQPHVCLYGTTVSGNFWKSMDVDTLEGGFLPRLVIFESKEEPIPGRALEASPPAEVINFFAYWSKRKITPGNLESAYPSPMVVPYTAEATAVMDEFKQLQKSEQKRLGDLGILWSRARENAGKLALIHACWRDSESPLVDLDSAHWATQVISHAVRHSIYEAHFCMSEGAFHERCQKVLRLLRQQQLAGNSEVSRSRLMRGTRNMTPRERDEAIRTLMEQGLISVCQIQTKGRPATHYKLQK